MIGMSRENDWVEVKGRERISEMDIDEFTKHNE